ncbi:MAG TPA: trypsin-like peptidase domain-containing protein [Acetobacteraceae bacterium]|nr:trypsin-like peptidase domain-containing protein [Acetobacteraceae bacterium]
MRLLALRGALPAAFVAILATLLPVQSRAAGVVDSGIADLVATLVPGVVNISTTQYKAIQLSQGKAVMVQDAEPDKRFFYGSGLIVTPDGHVVTNKHVTHNSITIAVTLSDGRQLPADLVSEAIGFDIAVIKIRTDKPLPTVKIGDSDTVRQGDLAIAIGNPLDFSSTVTTGVISALNRDMGFTPFDDYMQTDAAINHGNSGGPLFNRTGEVIGINSAIYTTGTDTGNVGIGLVIPINDAKFVVEHMHDMRLGKGRLAWLGAQVMTLTPELAGAFGLPGPWGSIVEQVPDGTPAAKAQLRIGDIITTYEGKQVNDSRALMRAIIRTEPDKTVRLGILRGGQQMEVPVTLVELPPNQTYGSFLNEPAVPKPDLPPEAFVDFGLLVASITPELRDKYQLTSSQQGVVTTGVAIGSAAANKRIDAGTVVLRVRDTAIASPAEFRSSIDNERAQKHMFVPLLISQQGTLSWVGFALN